MPRDPRVAQEYYWASALPLTSFLATVLWAKLWLWIWPQGLIRSHQLSKLFQVAWRVLGVQRRGLVWQMVVLGARCQGDRDGLKGGHVLWQG